MDTIKTLELIQRALVKAEHTNDNELRKDAECVLSALVLVLKHRRAKLQPGTRKSLERLELV